MLNCLFAHDRINILLNDDEQLLITSDDLELLTKINVDDYFAPDPTALLNDVELTVRDYYKLDRKDLVAKELKLRWINNFMDAFKDSNFYKEYCEYRG